MSKSPAGKGDRPRPHNPHTYAEKRAKIDFSGWRKEREAAYNKAFKGNADRPDKPGQKSH